MKQLHFDLDAASQEYTEAKRRRHASKHDQSVAGKQLTRDHDKDVQLWSGRIQELESLLAQ